MQNLAVDTTTSVNINFTYGGEFFTTEQRATTTTRVEFPVGVAMSTQKIVIDTVEDNTSESDGFLKAVLERADDSPLLPSGTMTSTVTILDDESVVSIGIPGGGDEIFVGEDAGSVTLVLSITPSFTRERSVNLLYTEDVGALDGTLSEVPTPDRLRVVTVPAGTATQMFTIPVVDDEIFAEGTRTATISIEAGDGYTLAASRTVSLGIEDDDRGDCVLFR